MTEKRSVRICYRSSILCHLLIAATAAAAEIRFSGEELAGLIQYAFTGTKIRFHQEAGAPGPFSYIDLGPNFKAQRFVFSVPPKDIDLGVAGKARYVLNDIHVAETEKPIQVTAAGNAFILELDFEDGGTELKGVPLGRLRRLRAGAIPDVEIKDIRLLITLLPSSSADGMRISFQPSDVAFLGSTQASGLGSVPFFGRRVDLLNPLTDYKRVIRGAIEREVKKLIDRNLPRLAEQVTTEIRRRGAAIGMKISRVRFEGTDLVISGSVTLR